MIKASYKELKAQLTQRENEKRDMDSILSLLKKYGLVVKIVESRLEFDIRRIKELKNSMQRVQDECQHNWVDMEDDRFFKCSKCELEYRKTKIRR